MSLNQFRGDARQVLTLSVVLIAVLLAASVCSAADEARKLREHAERVLAVKFGLLTWRGIYKLKQTSLVSDPVVLPKAEVETTDAGQDNLSRKLQPTPEYHGEYYRMDEAEVEFSADCKSGNFRAHWKSTAPVKYQSIESGETVVDYAPAPDVISILTDSDYFWWPRSSPAEVGRPQGNTGSPTNQVRRIHVAYRDRPEAGRGHIQYSFCFSPLYLYEVGGQVPEKGLVIAADLIEKGDESAAKIYPSDEASDVVVVERKFVSSKPGIPGLTTVDRYRLIDGKLAVLKSAQMFYGKSREHADVEKTWEWKLYDGFYLPSKWVSRRYDSNAGRTTFERSIELVETDVNQAIDIRRFGANGLDLKNGDFLKDSVTNEVLVQTVDGLQNPDQVSKVVPVQKPKGMSVFLLVNLVVAMFFAVFVVFRAYRLRNAKRTF